MITLTEIIKVNDFRSKNIIQEIDIYNSTVASDRPEFRVRCILSRSEAPY